MLEKYGRCFILDGHSFSSAPLPYELRQKVERPHICLGTDAFHTPEAMVRKVELLCGSHGVETARNRPFEGTYVPLTYWQKDPRVISLMIEIRRDCYMNEHTGTETEGFQRMRKMMVGVMEVIRQEMEG